MCTYLKPVLFIDVEPPPPLLGQTVHPGGKPRAVFQGGDARQRTGRADVPPSVRPEEKEGVGPDL